MSRKSQIRKANFLRILRERYDDSPVTFEQQTGYGQNMVSQIKIGSKEIGDKLGETLERHMKLPPGTLEREVANAEHHVTAQKTWPLSVPLADFESLSPRIQRELDEAFTRMVVGAQAQDLLTKQSKRKRAS